MEGFTPVAITSLHGFKSHGKWQNRLSNFISTQQLPSYSFDYGYQFFSCLIPGFKKRLIDRFYKQYSELLNNKFYNIDIKNPKCRPSIIIHSLGSYILCNAMLKYPDIKFDKIILCGSIVKENFDWDLIFRRDQVFFVRNEYSQKDKIVRWGWILSQNNSGYSGWKGFEYFSEFFEQQEFKHFAHDNFFFGNHMEEYWLPFLLKKPPTFRIVRGGSIKTISEFTKYFDQTEKIDDASFGMQPDWDDFAIPDGLAEKWIETNSEIYSFLTKDEKLSEVIGYINAMPLINETFERLLGGKIHDHEIRPSDILQYEEITTYIDLYVMSIAITPDFLNMHLGLRTLGFTKLFDSLIDKIAEYYSQKRIKIRRIAAIGWTEKGERLCKLIGMVNTGIVEDKTNKPIYLLEINENTEVKGLHRSIQKLIQLYRS